MSIPVAIQTGQKSGAGAAAATQLVTDAVLHDINSISIKNMSAAAVYVGTSAVSAANGFKLSQNESVSIDIQNAGDIYVYMSSAETVCWIASKLAE